MAFIMIPKDQQPSFPEPNKLSFPDQKVETTAKNDVVTSQLYLKSSESLDRDVVLRRLRHHKKVNKFRTSFEGFISQDTTVSALEQKWLELCDSFSSP